MALGKLIKSNGNGNGNGPVFQQCLIVRQRKPFTCDLPEDEVNMGDELLWTVLDPETNNVLIEGVDSEFLAQEVESGRLEISSGWTG